MLELRTRERVPLDWAMTQNKLGIASVASDLGDHVLGHPHTDVGGPGLLADPAFDLLELDGTDLRREPIEVRKATLASILRRSRHGVCLNDHLEHDCGLTVFQHACKMGLEGSSRSGSARATVWAAHRTG